MERHSIGSTTSDEHAIPLLQSKDAVELSAFTTATSTSSSSSDPTFLHLGSENHTSEPRFPNPDKKEAPVTWSSLPHKSQLLILASCRLSEPLSNTCLLPYLYYLIRSLASNENDQKTSTISQRAGLLVATFALAQFATSMLWAKLADKYGRKPVIVYPLLVSIIANVGFGFGTTIPTVMFWRLVAGVANGNIGVMRTMTAEIVQEKKYQSRAFLLLPLIFNSGNIAGLALGGLLATPTKSIPWLFGQYGLFNISRGKDGVQWMIKYPFALPTIANAIALSVALILALTGLKETLPSKASQRDFGIALRKRLFRLVFRANGYKALSGDEEVDLPKHHPKHPAALSSDPLPSLKSRAIAMTLLGFTLLPFHNATFMQVFPIFLSTPSTQQTPHSGFFFTGGLGYESSTIGLYLSTFGCSGIFLQMFIYPTLQSKFGTLKIFRLAFILFPLTYILTPYVLLLEGVVARGVAIAIVLFLQVMARTLAIPSSVILLTNAAPSPRVLGTLHGIGNMMSSLARALGPALGGWVSAKGVEIGMVGCVWWTYLTGIAAVGVFVSWKMEEGKSPHEKERDRLDYMNRKTND